MFVKIGFKFCNFILLLVFIFFLRKSSKNFIKIDIVTTLLAMLEMAKFGLVRFFQSEQGTIYLTARFEDRDEAYRLVGDVEETYAG